MSLPPLECTIEIPRPVGFTTNPELPPDVNLTQRWVGPYEPGSNDAAEAFRLCIPPAQKVAVARVSLVASATRVRAVADDTWLADRDGVTKTAMAAIKLAADALMRAKEKEARDWQAQVDRCEATTPVEVILQAQFWSIGMASGAAEEWATDEIFRGDRRVIRAIIAAPWCCGFGPSLTKPQLQQAALFAVDPVAFRAWELLRSQIGVASHLFFQVQTMLSNFAGASRAYFPTLVADAEREGVAQLPPKVVAPDLGRDGLPDFGFAPVSVPGGLAA